MSISSGLSNIDYNNVQYLRAWSLQIANTQEVIAIDSLKIRFTVKKADVGTPQAAMIRIYNLADATAKQIQKEFTYVILQAGYTGNMGLIFNGQIRQVRNGRENATDTYTDILATDSDEAHNFAVVNTTLAPTGSNNTQSALVQACINAMGQYNVQQGYLPTFNGPSLPRGRVMFGPARDFLNIVTKTAGCSWHIDNGQLNVKPIGFPLPGEVVVINAGSGMIGAPRQTINGIELKALINPHIKFGGQIQIDNSLVQQLQLDPSFNASASGNNFFIDPNTGQNTGLNADGYYVVYAINYEGDSRGDEWYMDIICASAGLNGPISSTWTQAVPSTLGN